MSIEKVNPERRFKHIFSYLSRGFAEGSVTMKLVSAVLYTRYYVKTADENLMDEVRDVIACVERINQKWPGAFIPVHPAIPQPENPRQILWIVDSTAWWPIRRGVPPTYDDIIRVGLGEDA